ncbi:MAG: Smr/MutS family protein [Burkholderiales bacterium]
MRGLDQLGALRKQLEQQAQQRAEEDKKQKAAAEQAERERDLFRTAVGAVVPVQTASKARLDTTPPAPVATQRLQDEQRALAQSLSDEFDPESLLETDEALSWQRAPLGPDVPRKLRKGHWVIQDQVELHGARTDEARELVGGFLSDCLKRGLRCVRIVHGKGHGSRDRQPVLKGKVPKWLMQRDEVIAFCQAKPADGGAGALIVLLKATR